MWVLLTWTRTTEVLLVGAFASAVVGFSLAPFGEPARPWRLFAPRRAYHAVVLLLRAIPRIVTANVSLARRIWAPSRPLASGMVRVPTRVRTHGGLCAVGVVTSLIVDNQIVDVDRSKDELLYHAVEVPSGDRQSRYEAINALVERHVVAMEHR